MGRPPQKSVGDKARIVVTVLCGELTVAEAARRECTSATSIGKWGHQLLAAGQAALTEGARHGPGGKQAL